MSSEDIKSVVDKVIDKIIRVRITDDRVYLGKHLS